MDGSGRLTKRNRRFLRPIKTYKSVLEGSQETQRSTQPMGPGAQGVAGSQRSTQPMGPVAQGEARDVAAEGKDVVEPRGSTTSPPVTGVKGRWPGDLEPFSNLGKADRGMPGNTRPGSPGTRSGKLDGGGKSQVSHPASSGPDKTSATVVVSGPGVKPVRYGVSSLAPPQSIKDLRG